MKSAFESATGGVLFIDEAYALVEHHEGSFGDEAINTIVQEMENLRDDIIVIFAGYPDKMSKFLDRNPGLRSRIAFHVQFPDYSVEELTEIFKLMLKDKGLTLAKDALPKVREQFAKIKDVSDFGNGRYFRNLLEQSIMKQASRATNAIEEGLPLPDINIIEAVDIEEYSDIFAEPKRSMGFIPVA